MAQPNKRSMSITRIYKRTEIARRLASKNPAKAWDEARCIIEQWGVHFDDPRAPDVHDMLRKLHKAVALAGAESVRDPVYEASAFVDIALAKAVDPKIPIRIHGLMMYGFQHAIPEDLSAKMAFCFLTHFFQLSEEDKTFVGVATACQIDFAFVLVRARIGLDVLPYAIACPHVRGIDDYYVAVLLALIEMSLEARFEIDLPRMFDKADRIAIQMKKMTCSK